MTSCSVCHVSITTGVQIHRGKNTGWALWLTCNCNFRTRLSWPVRLATLVSSGFDQETLTQCAKAMEDDSRHQPQALIGIKVHQHSHTKTSRQLSIHHTQMKREKRRKRLLLGMAYLSVPSFTSKCGHLFLIGLLTSELKEHLESYTWGFKQCGVLTLN